MSYLLTVPSELMSAATDLAGIGSSISAANQSAASLTTSIAAAGADEVSAAIAALFGAHAQAYQQQGALVAAFHDQFVRSLTRGRGELMRPPRSPPPRPCRPSRSRCWV